MATVKISLGGAMGAGVPSFPRLPRASLTLTSTASSQPMTTAAKQGEFVHITSSGGAVHCTAHGDASATVGYLVTDGETKTIGPLNEGDLPEIIDA